MLGLYRKLSTRAPLGVAFATCFVKGSASDAVSQQVVEQRPALDVQRNTAFAFFSGAYLGCGQHFVYNVAFTRVFGSGRSAGVALCKVLTDAIVHVPCVYLPLYYAFETPALGKGSPYDGLVRYREDAYDVLTTYWSTWPAVHFVSFTMLPPEVRPRRLTAAPPLASERYRSARLPIVHCQLRIAFVASASFLWLIYLSFASHKRIEAAPLTTEKAAQQG